MMLPITAKQFGSGVTLAAALLAAFIVARPLCGQFAAGRSEVKVYAVPKDRLADVAGQLQEKYAGQSAIRIVADERTNKVVVAAPSGVQQDVMTWLDLALAAPGSEPAAFAAADVAPEQQIQLAHSAHPLRHVSAREAERSLAAIWGNRASFETNPTGDATTIHLQSGKHGAVKLIVDHQRDLVMIDAPRQAMDSWRRVIQAVDAARDRASEQTDVVPFSRADPAKIQRAIGLIGAATRDPAAVAAILATAAGNRRQHIGQFVSMIFQAEGAQPPAGDSRHLRVSRLAAATSRT